MRHYIHRQQKEYIYIYYEQSNSEKEIKNEQKYVSHWSPYVVLDVFDYFLFYHLKFVYPVRRFFFWKKVKFRKLYHISVLLMSDNEPWTEWIFPIRNICLLMLYGYSFFKFEYNICFKYDVICTCHMSLSFSLTEINIFRYFEVFFRSGVY